MSEREEKALSGKGGEEDHRLIFGDCLSGMAALADGSVGCTITDPPYEAEAHTLQRRTKDAKNGHATGRESNGCRGSRVAGVHALTFAPITEEDRAEAARQIVRLTRRWILVFCQAEAVARWRDALETAGAKYRRAMIWVKPDAQPQLTGDGPGMGYESIVVAHAIGKGRSRWNAGGKCGVYSFNKNASEQGEARLHPTQKPRALMEALTLDFTEPGEMVFDPYAGSCTTGVACKRLGRRFLGFERGWATLTKEEQETMPPHAQAGLLYARNAALVAKSQARIDAAREQFNLGPRPPKPRQSPLFEKQK